MQEYLAGGEGQWRSPPPGRSRIGVQKGVGRTIEGVGVAGNWETGVFSEFLSDQGGDVGVILSAFSSGTDVEVSCEFESAPSL